MRVSFDVNSLEKTLGIKINYQAWDSHHHQINHQPVHNSLLKQKTEEYKQKIMGAYYILTKEGAEFTIREILDNAFGNTGARLYSLVGVFENAILKMEKQLKPFDGVSNIGKHRTCLQHMRNFLRQEYKLNDIGYSRINRSFIEDFELFLKTGAGK